MEGKTEKRRKLVANIESGKYKSNKGTSGTAIIVAAVTFFFIFIMTLIPVVLVGGGASVMGLMLLLLIMSAPFAVIFIVANAGRGADLGKLNQLERWLILYGDEIEADLDSIEQNGNLYTFRCTANYKGKNMRFTSRQIGVPPIPSENRKISVFINPDDSSQFLINVYERLPLAGDNVLHDRSELKVGANKKNPYQGSYIALVIICAVLLLPIAFFAVLAGIGGILNGNIAFGFFLMVLPMVVTVLVIVGAIRLGEKQKTVAEKGYYVPATAMKFWVTRSKNSTTYHLSARYIEPSTKIVHEFQTSGPSAMKTLVGAKVNTYLNPDNTREYFMDIQGALKKLGFTTSREKDE